MTTLFLKTEASLAELIQRAQDRIMEFTDFEVGVLNIQRRNKRTLVCKCLDDLGWQILAQLSRAKQSRTVDQAGIEISQVGKAIIGIQDAKKTTAIPEIEVTSEGTVSLSQFFRMNSVALNEGEFKSCLERIKKRVSEDLVDVTQAPETIAKTYFAEYCKQHSKRSV